MKRLGYRVRYIGKNGCVYLLRGYYDTLEEAEKKRKELQPIYKHNLFVGLEYEA